jgi:hypothetical protein
MIRINLLKKPFPQPVSRTGLSGDYNNEIAIRLMWLKEAKEYKEYLDLFTDSRMRTYTERYPVREYHYPVGDRPRLARISRLNEIARKVNELTSDIKRNSDNIIRLLREAFFVLKDEHCKK